MYIAPGNTFKENLRLGEINKQKGIKIEKLKFCFSLATNRCEITTTLVKNLLMGSPFGKAGLPTLLKDGYKHLQGLDEAGYRNIDACQEMTKITKSSLGPNGRNKMIINHLEKLFVTSDAATILKELDVVHPAAKIIAMASQQQETEMGDATNFVIVFAGELLSKAEELLRMGLPISNIVEGYEIAFKQAKTILEEIAVETISNFEEKSLERVIKSTVASKQYGYEDFLAQLVANACHTVMPKNTSNFSVDNVRVVKVLGGSILDTKVVNGMVFGREAEGHVLSATSAKIAIFTCPLDIGRTETKGTVLIKDANELMNFNKSEESGLEKQFQELADANVKVLVTGSSISDMALHFINRFEMMAVKVLSKFDLRRLCRVTGATALARLGVPMAEEMGHCDRVEAIEIGSDRCTVFRQEKEDSRTVSIVVRGGTQNLLDDMERAIDDGVNCVKGLTKDARLLAGAGASEIEVAKRLFSFGEKYPGLAQHAIKKYAEAFEVIPRTLAENAGMDSTVILSKLYAAHSQSKSAIGVDIEMENEGLLDAYEKSILDPYVIKANALRLATDSALTVLRVDQIIMSKPAGGPKPPKQKNYEED